MGIGCLSAGALLSGILAVWFGYRQPRGGFYLFKPLTTILIILIPVLAAEYISLLTGLILAGLIFSLLGDIFLMLPEDCFLEGLIAFLIAHLFYIAGFLVDQGTLAFWPLLPILGLSGVIGWFLYNGMGKMRIPSFIYLGVISVMVWLAWSRWISGGQPNQLLGFCGASLFFFSDFILATNRFKVNFKAARALNLTTYYAGQYLIALSVINLDVFQA
jgi:uncharacterized membrane protein YhhN